MLKYQNILDRTEYNRNYYYKRDKTKLKQYRDKYNKKIKNRNYVKRWMKKHPDKAKEARHLYYLKTREERLEKMNFEYRANKLKEFVDNVLNIPDDNIVNNYGQR